MVDDQLESFGADTLVPIRASNPIAYLALVFTDLKIRRGCREISDASDYLAGLLQLDGPGAVVREKLPYHVQALIHALMRRPACTGPDLGVGRIFEKRRGVTLQPRAKKYPVSFHTWYKCNELCPLRSKFYYICRELNEYSSV